MDLKSRIKNMVGRFARDKSGAVAVEAAIILPLLAAWFVGSFVFFDAFKNRNTALKATYTIGDILSRRIFAANPDYVESLHDLYQTLTFTDENTSAVRISSLSWDGTKHVVEWSHRTSDVLTELTTEGVDNQPFRDRIPLMTTSGTVLVVETFQNYNPLFDVGWSNQVWENFIVTSPRFASCVPFEIGEEIIDCTS